MRKRLNLFGGKKNGVPEDNAYIASYKEGFIFDYVKPEDIPAGSQEREYKGRFVHLLSFGRDEVLRAIDAPREIQPNESPSELGAALNCSLVSLIFGIPESTLDKIGYVAFYVLIACDLIFAFLIWGASL